MNRLTIFTENDRTTFEPGETLRGRAEWTLEKEPERAELHLIAAATLPNEEEALEVFHSERLSPLEASDEHRFEIELPGAPASCEEGLFTLRWTLELTVEPGELVTQVPLVIAPGGEALRLEKVETPKDTFSIRTRKRV